MGKDVVKLSSFIENNRGQLKYLISDRVSIPNSIIRKLNKEDNIVTENLRTVTIENISKNIVMGYYAYTGKDYDKEDIFTAEEAYLIQDILLSSKEDKIYGFLPKTSISLETSKEILRIINILREGKCTLSEYLSQTRFKMRLQRREWDRTGKAEITRDRANLTRTVLSVCDSNNEKNGQNFISVFEMMKNKRIIG